MKDNISNPNKNADSTNNTNNSNGNQSGNSSDNRSVHLTGNDKLDLELIEKEITASYIGIISFILLIASAEQSRNAIFENQKEEASEDELASAEIGVLAFSTALIANIMLQEIACTRLKELENNIANGLTNDSITPNIFIANGYALSTISLSLKTIGAIGKLKEQTSETIF